MGQLEEDATEKDYDPHDFRDHPSDSDYITDEELEAMDLDQSHLLEEDFKVAINEANCYAEVISMANNKARYRSNRGHECKIIRSTDSTVTLLIYDNPNDPHEWTTSIDNFVKNYVLIS